MIAINFAMLWQQLNVFHTLQNRLIYESEEFSIDDSKI